MQGCLPKIVNEADLSQSVIRNVAECGYTAATARQIAAAADVSERTLFRKFGSKQDLVKQAISSIISRADLAGAVQCSADLHADLRCLVRAYLNSAVVHDDSVSALFAELILHPELADPIDEPLRIFLAIEA